MREHEVTALPLVELQRARWELAASLALTWVLILAKLTVIEAIAARSPGPSQEPAR